MIDLQGAVNVTSWGNDEIITLWKNHRMQFFFQIEKCTAPGEPYNAHNNTIHDLQSDIGQEHFKLLRIEWDYRFKQIDFDISYLLDEIWIHYFAWQLCKE